MVEISTAITYMHKYKVSQMYSAANIFTCVCIYMKICPLISKGHTAERFGELLLFYFFYNFHQSEIHAQGHFYLEQFNLLLEIKASKLNH